jgi:hypothetical protein
MNAKHTLNAPRSRPAGVFSLASKRANRRFRGDVGQRGGRQANQGWRRAGTMSTRGQQAVFPPPLPGGYDPAMRLSTKRILASYLWTCLTLALVSLLVFLAPEVLAWLTTHEGSGPYYSDGPVHDGASQDRSL